MTGQGERAGPGRRFGLGCAAVVTELVACHAVLAYGLVGVAVALHVVASVFCALTAERSAQTYRDALFLGALAVPLLGPMVAWILPSRPRAGVANAHAFFENYEADIHGEVELEERDPESRTRTMSFHEVLRYGTLDHRRNALRKLAERGQPMHLQLLRRCLSNPDMELRLGAFTELDRLLHGWEERLSALQAAVEETPGDPERRAALSRAHREYAASGLLDEDTARFQLGQAARACDLETAPAAKQTDLAVERAMVFAEVGDLERAALALREVDAVDVDEPRVCIARARIAFLTRRFGDVRREVDSLRSSAAEVPRWMDELAVNA